MATIPVERFCRTEEVAATTLLFAENGYITGKIYASNHPFQQLILIRSRWRTLSSIAPLLIYKQILPYTKKSPKIAAKTLPRIDIS